MRLSFPSSFLSLASKWLGEIDFVNVLLIFPSKESNIEANRIGKSSALFKGMACTPASRADAIATLYSRMAIGTNMQARSLLAQRTSKPRYVALAKRGNPAPNIERIKLSILYSVINRLVSM